MDDRFSGVAFSVDLGWFWGSDVHVCLKEKEKRKKV